MSKSQRDLLILGVMLIPFFAIAIFIGWPNFLHSLDVAREYWK